MDLATKLFKGDRVVWIVFMILCAISVIEVFSATSTLTYKDGNYWGPIIRHSLFLMVGFGVVLVVHNIPYRFFSALTILLPISAGLLLFTLFFGKEINNANRYMSLFGVSFQPSEIAKLACIVFVAFLLSKRNMFTDSQIFKYILIGVSIICVLIMPENFSTAALLFAVCFLMMFVGQISMIRLGGLLLVLILLLALFISYLYLVKEEWLPDRAVTWKTRIEEFFKPKPPLNAATYVINDYNRQETFAKIAIADGRMGKLPGRGVNSDFLPQAFSDFIYAIIIEEMGVLGGFLVLLLYVILLFRAGMIARKCEKLFPKFLVLGCGLLIAVQAFANMGVVVGLFPVTGQPLPLISRGGTSTIITCVYVGIILSISRFGAGMGNEEDVDEETDSDIIEYDSSISEDTPLTAVATLTETNV
ncbi:rod shape-determining protein RodA [Bacteroidia bacterium]|nr:rod shape-determining protein RodA [Bacteroidia bacterium]